MKNNTRQQNRLQFLKESTLLFTGLVFFPDLLSAKLRNTQFYPQMASCGKVSIKIMIPQYASPKEQQAADTLQKHLSTLPNACITLITETDPQGVFTIYLGHTLRSREKNREASEWAEDGFTSITANDHIILAGGSGKGLLYAVYDLLSELGFKR